MKKPGKRCANFNAVKYLPWAALVSVVVLTSVIGIIAVIFQMKHSLRWGVWHDHYETLNAYVTSIEASLLVQDGGVSYFSESVIVGNYSFFLRARANMRDHIEAGAVPRHAAEKITRLLSRAIALFSNRLSDEDKNRIIKAVVSEQQQTRGLAGGKP